MTLIALLILLIVFELLYFQIAQKYNIIDKPNDRSSHTEITIRGGGIIFWAAATIYFIYSDYNSPYFFIGLSLVTFISFLDDIFTLPNRYRLPFQFLAIISILFEVDFFINPVGICALTIIIGVGIINAYNFMDGINGITGGYSLVVIGALWFINSYHIKFIDDEFFVFILIGLMVFNYFNFRKKAKCFAGDVGSISIAVIILFLLLKLIVREHNPIYILFLAVYGVDSVLTITHRLLLKENIFKAHRLHLFQVMVHTLKIPHLIMASLYMLVQAIICVIIIINLKSSEQIQWIISFSIIMSLSALYFTIKRSLC